MGPKLPKVFVEVTSKNPFSVPNTDWSTVDSGFAAELAVKLKHKKYDDLTKNSIGPGKPSLFVFAVETTGSWAKENSIFLDHLKDVAQFKLPEYRLPTFIPNLARSISLNHRKAIVQGLLDVFESHSPSPVHDKNLCLQDLEHISLFVEDGSFNF